MKFKDFVKGQKKVYGKFRDVSKLEREGLVPKLPEQQGGYLIVLRHSDAIAEKIAEFSERVNKVVPSIDYNKEIVHTTISDFDVRDDFSPDSNVLENLTKAVCEALPLTYSNFQITYSGWLLNQNTGIAEGYPNRTFFNIAKRIIESAQRKGIELRFPWGGHITTNRFKERISATKVLELIKMFKDTEALGESFPRVLDVGHFQLFPMGLNYEIHERFRL